MATFAGTNIRAKGPGLMSKKPRRVVTQTTVGKVPVKVGLRRINSDYARPYPPDGQAREWREIEECSRHCLEHVR
jgi:hypothetical protein